MNLEEFAESIYLNLPYDPNDQQIELIAALAAFCSDATPSDSVFLLNGYAGTGKTSLTGALVRSLAELRIPVVLMAPTGRAAKVFSRYAGFPATTIHRRIYRTGDGGSIMGYAAEVAENPLSGAVFIVDEASMIGDSPDETNTRSGLLEDLIHYVYSGDNCRLILLGDTAQLPPVGCEESPAMSVKQLRGYGLRVTRCVLTKIVRQRLKSGILYNATRLRRDMKLDPLPEPRICVSRFDDVEAVSGEDFQDMLASSYSNAGTGETLLVTRSNKRATLYNLAIRTKILDLDEELTAGERLMVVKNNYLWSAKVRGLDFVANGDIAEVERIIAMEERYGLRFADVGLRLTDRDISFECKIMLDTLTSDPPALEPQRFAELYQRLLNDPDLFTPSTTLKTRMRMLRSDPYLNALQVKYAYAVTCHKAQGGQWSDIYVDVGYLPPDYSMASVDFYRWLYTATTRATSRLCFVNPPFTLD